MDQKGLGYCMFTKLPRIVVVCDVLWSSFNVNGTVLQIL